MRSGRHRPDADHRRDGDGEGGHVRGLGSPSVADPLVVVVEGGWASCWLWASAVGRVGPLAEDQLEGVLDGVAELDVRADHRPAAAGRFTLGQELVVGDPEAGPLLPELGDLGVVRPRTG